MSDSETTPRRPMNSDGSLQALHPESLSIPSGMDWVSLLISIVS